MFGRRKKKDEPTGLAGLSTEASVTVSPSPAAPVSASPTAAPSASPSVTAINLGGASGGAAALSQILSGQGPIGELIAQIKADPAGFRDRMIAQAQAMGASTYVLTPQGMTPLSAPGATASPQHIDVVEELTKAAELHDKGVLSDAEFESLKKKLLGE
jgi:Short C-terminal domain